MASPCQNCDRIQSECDVSTYPGAETCAEGYEPSNGPCTNCGRSPATHYRKDNRDAGMVCSPCWYETHPVIRG